MLLRLATRRSQLAKHSVTWVPRLERRPGASQLSALPTGRNLRGEISRLRSISSECPLIPRNRSVQARAKKALTKSTKSLSSYENASQSGFRKRPSTVSAKILFFIVNSARSSWSRFAGSRTNARSSVGPHRGQACPDGDLCSSRS